MQVELFAGVMTFLYMTYRWENFDIKLHSLRTKNIKKYKNDTKTKERMQA